NYGLLQDTVVARDVTDQYTADLYAKTEVAERAQPKPTIQASVFEPGLTRGMTVAVQASKYGFAMALIVRTMQISIIAPDRDRTPVAGHVLKYSATLGWRPPDIRYQLLRLQRVPTDSTTTPVKGVEDGGIGPSDLAAGLEMIRVVDALPLPIPADY